MCSWTLQIRTRLFRISRYFELKIISVGFTLQSFTVGYLELPQLHCINFGAKILTTNWKYLRSYTYVESQDELWEGKQTEITFK